MSRLMRWYDLEDDPIERARMMAAYDAEQIARSQDIDSETRERVSLALSRIAEGSPANDAFKLKRPRGRPKDRETDRRRVKIAERIHELVESGMKPTPASQQAGEESGYDKSHALAAYNEYKAAIEDRRTTLESIRARRIEIGPEIIERAIRDSKKQP